MAMTASTTATCCGVGFGVQNEPCDESAASSMIPVTAQTAKRLGACTTCRRVTAANVLYFGHHPCLPIGLHAYVLLLVDCI